MRQQGGVPTGVFYDVTSSYLEGACHALAAFGYNRDNKAGKTQSVIGLVTTGTGEPFAVQVFDGNTSDPLTGPAQVETLRTRFGITEGVCVGDRGMVKRKGKTVLAAAGSKYITALPPPQVRKLLREDVVRPEWFTSHVHEVQHGPVRLVLRRSEAVRCKAPRRRADPLAKLHAVLTARHAFVQTAQRAKPEAGLRTLRAWGKRHKLDAFVHVSLHEGQLTALLDTTAQAEVARLEGCDVRETDVPQTALDAQPIHDRYRDLHEVAQDFRTMKTGRLAVRPIFVRKAPRPRAHVFVTMLAVHVVREMRWALVAAFGTTDDDQRAVTVEEALVA